jgi:AcrR family transcriptional regulator
MVENVTPDRQQIILDATLELVSEIGLIQTSISKISKRANASPGIIYHYFSSKDEIMDNLYQNVMRELMDTLLDEDVLALPTLERLKTIWLRRFHYHIDNPAQTTFIEQYKNSSYFNESQRQATYALLSDLGQMVQTDIENGKILNLPLEVIQAMTLGLATSLAKSQLEKTIHLDADMLNMIAENACQSVLA